MNAMTSPFSLRILIKMIRFFSCVCIIFVCSECCVILFIGLGLSLEDFLGCPFIFRSDILSGAWKVCVGVLQGLNDKLHSGKIYWTAVCFSLGMVPFPQAPVPGSCGLKSASQL